MFLYVNGEFREVVLNQPDEQHYALQAKIAQIDNDHREGLMTVDERNLKLIEQLYQLSHPMDMRDLLAVRLVKCDRCQSITIPSVPRSKCYDLEKRTAVECGWCEGREVRPGFHPIQEQE